MEKQYQKGNDIDTSTQISEKHCQSKCCSHPQCTGYDWYESQKQCYLSAVLWERVVPTTNAQLKVCRRKPGLIFLHFDFQDSKNENACFACTSPYEGIAFILFFKKISEVLEFFSLAFLVSFQIRSSHNTCACGTINKAVTT